MGVGVKREAEEGYARAGLLPGQHTGLNSAVAYATTALYASSKATFLGSSWNPSPIQLLGT